MRQTLRRRTGKAAIAGVLLAAAAVPFAGSAAGQAPPPPTLRFATIQNGTTLVVVNGSNADVTRTPITGLRPDERIVGLDVRPRNPTQLYGIGSSSQVYIIDRASATATRVGAQFTPALDGSSFGVDFNPTVDRIRVISDTDQNLRLHPDTGEVVAVDTPLNYAPGDPNEGANPTAVGAAYTFTPFPPNGAATTLFDVDSALDILTIQSPPNAGVLNTVGSLRFNTEDAVGFDIAGGQADPRAYGLFRDRTASKLLRVRLDSGRASATGIFLQGQYDGLAMFEG